jgi:hypothetical protein
MRMLSIDLRLNPERGDLADALAVFAACRRLDGASTLREATVADQANLILPERCLAVFVDDTGHEALLPDHKVYGLGGCAVLAPALDPIVCLPWREVRRRVTGSPDTPLHASEFDRPDVSKGVRAENIRAVVDFFQTQPFARLGAIISIATTLADKLGPVPTIAKVLQARIAEIARWTPFDSLAVIIESSERADRLVEDAFQGFALEEGGKAIPVECYFMRKEHAEPALEVADFIMHAVGRQARQNLKKRGDFTPDFCAVFHAVDRKLASFMEVDSVSKQDRASA